MGKLAQAVMHGAKIIQIDGNFDDCLELARKLTADYPTIALVNSVNPVRIEGQKTAAFEIVDASARHPTCTRCRWATPETSPPTARLHRVPPRWRQRQAAAPCSAPRQPAQPRWCSASRVTNPETIATAIRIGSPASWDGAPWPHSRSRAAASWPRPTTRFSPHIAWSPRPRGCSWSRHRPPASRAAQVGRGRLGQAGLDGGVHRDRQRTKDPDTALRGMPTVTAIPVDPSAVVAELGLV